MIPAGRLLMASSDSQAIACPLSGRNSTYRPVQISGTRSKGVMSDSGCLNESSGIAPGAVDGTGKS
jgi:hypothetical protein